LRGVSAVSASSTGAMAASQSPSLLSLAGMDHNPFFAGEHRMLLLNMVLLSACVVPKCMTYTFSFQATVSSKSVQMCLTYVLLSQAALGWRYWVQLPVLRGD
jgi:hypothetical protein